MKHCLLTGGTGTVGRFIAARLKQDGYRLTYLGRTRPDDPSDDFLEWDLSAETYSLPDADILVHCALSHVPGKFRDGEGDDPHGFITLNVDGTRTLFEAAKQADVQQCFFLSTRAVYSDVENWAVLVETAETEPESLYGKVKLAGEQALELICDQTMTGVVLRATGVYGNPPGRETHKWSQLLGEFERGEKIDPRHGTEVHGDDLASAVSLLSGKSEDGWRPCEVFNVSDLLLDQQDLLRAYGERKGLTHELPGRSGTPLGVMGTAKLETLGWVRGGNGKLEAFLDTL